MRTLLLSTLVLFVGCSAKNTATTSVKSEPSREAPQASEALKARAFKLAQAIATDIDAQATIECLKQSRRVNSAGGLSFNLAFGSKDSCDEHYSVDINFRDDEVFSSAQLNDI